MNNQSSPDFELIVTDSFLPDFKLQYDSVLFELKLVPTRMKQQLLEFGVKIINWPDISESLTSSYIQTNKTIYVGKLTTPDLLTGCAYAYDHLTGITRSSAMSEAIRADLQQLPKDLHQTFYFDLETEPEKVQQAFAGLFGAFLVFTQEPNLEPKLSQFLDRLRNAVPMTSKLVMKLIDETRCLS